MALLLVADDVVSHVATSMHVAHAKQDSSARPYRMLKARRHQEPVGIADPTPGGSEYVSNVSILPFAGMWGGAALTIPRLRDRLGQSGAWLRVISLAGPGRVLLACWGRVAWCWDDQSLGQTLTQHPQGWLAKGKKLFRCSLAGNCCGMGRGALGG